MSARPKLAFNNDPVVGFSDRLHQHAHHVYALEALLDAITELSSLPNNAKENRRRDALSYLALRLGEEACAEIDQVIEMDGAR